MSCPVRFVVIGALAANLEVGCARSGPDAAGSLCEEPPTEEVASMCVLDRAQTAAEQNDPEAAPWCLDIKGRAHLVPTAARR